MNQFTLNQFLLSLVLLSLPSLSSISLPIPNVTQLVGTSLLYEDATLRVCNFTLPPGESTSLHTHMHDYTFVAIKSSQLEVYGENGER